MLIFLAMSCVQAGTGIGRAQVAAAGWAEKSRSFFVPKLFDHALDIVQRLLLGGIRNLSVLSVLQGVGARVLPIVASLSADSFISIVSTAPLSLPVSAPAFALPVVAFALLPL